MELQHSLSPAKSSLTQFSMLDGLARREIKSLKYVRKFDGHSEVLPVKEMVETQGYIGLVTGKGIINLLNIRLRMGRTASDLITSCPKRGCLGHIIAYC